MHSADIHQTAAEGRLPKCDRLFRAAISGYCSLTRPTGSDAARLDDLAMPLLPLVSEESKRFAAAALSETLPAPPALLRRLADYPVAVSAPLLVRSRALADIDLIGLIGRNGVGHARAIGRRPGLNPNIAALVRALGAAPETQTTALLVDEPGEESPPAVGTAAQARPQSRAEDEARERLRAMMRPATEAPAAGDSNRGEVQEVDWVAAHAAYPRMVATGLTGVAALFQTAVADAFDLAFARAGEIVDDGEELPIALKSAGLTVAEAFLVVALAFPPRFESTSAIRTFVEAYRRIEVQEARRLVGEWHSRAPRAPTGAGIPAPANADGRPASQSEAGLLRAS